MNLLQSTCAAIASPAEDLRPLLQQRLDLLTKPRGSLGRLEELAIQIGLMQATLEPRAARKLVVVMAADHGIAAAGVSAFPSEVTAQMVRNFAAGGAAINVLARHAGARVLVVDMGVLTPVALPNVLDRRIGSGTRNFLEASAMDPAQARAALEAGLTIALAEADAGLDLIAGGDMGIANSTSSSAIIALVTGAAPETVVGRGTGLDDAGLARKRDALEHALARHAAWRSLPSGPERGIDLLSRVGGFEIAGLAGLMLGAASRRIPIVLDGFIATAAALAATELCPRLAGFLIAAHRSAEPGHTLALRHLGLRPLLEWQMRLGEGTGAALAFPVLDAACKVLAEMATFESAGVSTKTTEVN